MSNALAIAAVTETLSRIIENEVQTAVPGVQVNNAAPTAPPPANPTAVSVYLFNANESAHFRSNDLATRNPQGSLVTKPQIGLELDYLVSFYGQSDDLERERMFGHVVSRIHAQPVLSPDAIQQAIDLRVLADPVDFLATADLPQQVEGVRVTPLDLDLEAMSKLWSVFFQEPHTLSIGYRVSIVLIEVDAPTQSGLPVQVRQVRAVPSVAPSINSVSPASVAYSATGGSLVLTGSSLAAEHTAVFIDGVEAPAQLVTNSRIVLPVPNTVAAGVHVVHVAHLVDWGSPATPDLRPVLDSNRVPFALSPRVENVPAAVAAPGPLTVSLLPEVQADQTVRLNLQQTADSAGDSAPLAFEVEQTVATATSDFSFDVTDAVPGDYWVRVAVDDVLSTLDADATGFLGPQVTVT